VSEKLLPFNLLPADRGNFGSSFLKGKVSFHEMRAWISGLVTNQAGQLHNESKIFAQKC